MRRHVRYSALGRSRSVTLVFGAQRREAEVVDESAAGLGLKVHDAGGLRIGQPVVVEDGGPDRIDAAVLRIEALPDGGHLIGLRLGAAGPGGATAP